MAQLAASIGPVTASVGRFLERYGLPVAAGSLTLAVYLTTMAPTAFPLDSAELAAGAATLGLVHSPGYPVYLIIGHLFTRLPFGDVAFRMNLASALFTAISVGLLVFWLKRLTRSTVAATAAGLSFGFCFYAWALSVVAEVYTLQVLFLIILLINLWRWQEKSSTSGLLVAAFVMGLTLANNPGTVLWWPGLLLIGCGRRPSRKLMAEALGLFVLGLLFILYIPVRAAANPAVNYIGQYDAQGVFHAFDLTEPGAILWYITGRQFEWAFFAYSWPELIGQFGQFLYRLWATYLGIGLVVGLWGVWVLWRRQRLLAAGLVAVFLCHAAFFITYRAPDKDTMFLPTYMVWAILLGAGVAQLRRTYPKLGMVVSLSLTLGLLIVNYAYVDVSDLTLPRDIAEQRLVNAEKEAYYLAVWGDAAAMEYLQVVEGLRPDVKVINILMIPPSTRQELVTQALQDGRAVYTTFPDPALNTHFNLSPVAHGFRATGAIESEKGF